MIEPTANVEPDAELGEGTMVWARSHIRTGARVGKSCIIGAGVFIDGGVRVGDRCKIQNLAQIFSPAKLDDGVFIGPGVILANDLNPRAVSPKGELLAASQWTAVGVAVGTGAAVGAGAVVVPGVNIGAWALIGAGATVTRDVPAHAMVVGNPARQVGWVGRLGKRLTQGDDGRYQCLDSGEVYTETAGRLRRVGGSA